MCCFSGDSGFPFGAALTLEAVFFFFFYDGENDLAVLRRSLTGGFREKAFGGPPPLEVHYSLAHTECTRKPHLYSLFSHDSRSTCIRKNTHTHTCKRAQAYCSMAGALLLPQSMEYHICLFTPRFLSLNSINIYIAAEGVGSPSCSGGNSA